MTQEKSLLISSIHKLIKHIKQGPKNQHQIFNSLSKRDIQKIIKNVDDSNIQLRKASFSLITNLLSGSNSSIRLSICNHLKLPIIPGRIIINPKILTNLDSLDLKDVIYLIKNRQTKEASSSLQTFSQGKNNPLWQINVIQFPLRMQELSLAKVQTMDPKYCIFGMMIKEQDLAQTKNQFKQPNNASINSDYRYTFNSKNSVEQQIEKKNSPYFGNNWVKETEQNNTQTIRHNNSNTTKRIKANIRLNQHQQSGGQRQRIISDYNKYQSKKSSEKIKQQSTNHKSITAYDYLRLNGTPNQSYLNSSIKKQQFKETIQTQKMQYRNPISSPNIYEEPKSYSQNYIDIDKAQSASYYRNIQPSQKFYVNPYGTIHKNSLGLNKSIGVEKPIERQQISSAGRKNVYGGYNKTGLISSSQQYGPSPITYRNISSKTMYQPSGIQMHQGYKGVDFKHSKLPNNSNTEPLAYSVKHQYHKN